MGKGNRKVTVSAAEAVDNVSARRDGQPALAAAVTVAPDPEVAAKPTRRRFTAEYTLQILREAESQRAPGAIGALLRREGLYSTHLSAWRRERERGALETLRARRRGRKPDPTLGLRQQIAALEAEKQRLQERLRQAEAIMAAQKKWSWAGGPPCAMKTGHHRGTPRARKRRRVLVSRVRKKIDVGASGTPHWCLRARRSCYPRVDTPKIKRRHEGDRGRRRLHS